jgi:hypothetical protein
MKLPHLISGSLVSLALAGCASTAPTGGGTVTVKWGEPTKFTDFVPPRAEASYTLVAEQRRLENELIDPADACIPEGCNVRITFRDINRAGWIDPLAQRPVRVVTDQWPARVEFDYRVTDVAGGALRSGSATLRLAFPQYLRSRTEPESAMPDIREMFAPWFRQLGRQLPRGPQHG